MPVILNRILKGANPAELPVETVSRRELAINLRSARAIGIGIPNDLLKGADRIIE